MFQSAVSSAVLAVFFVVWIGTKGHLDANKVVLAILVAVAFGVLDHLLDYRRGSTGSGGTLLRQPGGRGSLLLRSAGNGALVALMILFAFGVVDNLDGGLAITAVAAGTLSGTLDYFRNRKQNRADEIDRTHESSAAG